MTDLQHLIEAHFASCHTLSSNNAPTEILHAVNEVMEGLDEGIYRVAEKINENWVVHEWLKKAILLSFKIYPNDIIHGGYSNFYDKLPLKYTGFDNEAFDKHGVRVVPHAIVRRGAFIGKNTVLMPSYVNVGAYIGENTMIDTWATVGSCAQIGNNVHLSGGAGIGGVLEPLQATPTIIEDNCFIGARSEVVEGVIIGRGAVLSMGVFIGKSTKIYNRMTREISYGYVPPGAVVVPGSLPSDDGSHSLSCAVIIKQVDEKTRAKVSINELLRGITP